VLKPPRPPRGRGFVSPSQGSRPPAPPTCAAARAGPTWSSPGDSSFPRCRAGMSSATLGVGWDHARAGEPEGRGASGMDVPTRERGNKAAAKDLTLVPTLRVETVFVPLRGVLKVNLGSYSRPAPWRRLAQRTLGFPCGSPKSCITPRVSRTGLRARRRGQCGDIGISSPLRSSAGQFPNAGYSSCSVLFAL